VLERAHVSVVLTGHFVSLSPTRSVLSSLLPDILTVILTLCIKVQARFEIGLFLTPTRYRRGIEDKHKIEPTYWSFFLPFPSKDVM